VVHRSRQVLQWILYIAAIILLPGAMIGAPILWWARRQRERAAAAGRVEIADRPCHDCA